MSFEELEKKMAELDELQAETENAHVKLKAQMAELDELQAETENAHVKLKAQMAELEKLQAETENAHAKLIAQMAELKAQHEESLKPPELPFPPEPPHKRPYPADDQIYFYVNPMGDVEQTKWTSEWFELRVREFGNVFKTEAEAKFAAERLKVLAEMREWAGSWNDEFTLRYDEINGIEGYNHAFPEKTYGEMHFATREDAMNCIKAVSEERLMKYYFGIPEEETKNG